MTKMRATDLVLDLIERVGDGAAELSELGMRSLGAAPLAGETRAATGLPVV
jgi:hypothetical protein